MASKVTSIAFSVEYNIDPAQSLDDMNKLHSIHQVLIGSDLPVLKQNQHRMHGRQNRHMLGLPPALYTYQRFYL